LFFLLFGPAIIPRHPNDLTLQQDGVAPIRSCGDVREHGVILHRRDAAEGRDVAHSIHLFLGLTVKERAKAVLS